MRFDLIPLRLELAARDTIHFPAGKASNVLRGALGMALPRVGGEAGARLFDPPPAGPSGLADPPRPFVFRVRELDGRSIRPEERFAIGVNLFAPAARDLLVAAFADAAREGFGPGRGRAELIDCSGDLVSLDLSPRPDAAARLRVEFLTPTELKHDGRIAERPEFGVLAARVRDRASALRALYGGGPLDLDFAGFGARAAAVRMTRCDLEEVARERRSSRTGQSHPIGGFTGSAEYAEVPGEFLPFLEAAQRTGVGRQAVWGNGEIAVSAIL